MEKIRKPFADGDRYSIDTTTDAYWVWIDGSKGYDELFAPYKPPEER